MGYISTQSRGNKIGVWERVSSHREYNEYSTPYYFFVENEEGEHTDIYGRKLHKIECSDRQEFEQLVAQYKMRQKYVCETDISAASRILSELYYNAPPSPINISMYDIEVDYDKDIGYSSPSNPYAPINAISIWHAYNNKSVVLAVPPPHWDKPLNIDTASEIRLFKNEKDLLLSFLNEIENSDALFGWNSETFDNIYVAKRLLKYGEVFLRRMNFSQGRTPSFKMRPDNFGGESEVVDVRGRIWSDYLLLFKKFEFIDRPSYKLESIAAEFLPHLPKLEYKGTLSELYNNDFDTFVLYNIRDTEILSGLETKLQYASTAVDFYQSSQSEMTAVYGTIKLAESNINNYCWNELNLRVPNAIRTDNAAGIAGALVLPPQVGIHKWVGSIDINSLYPSVIRSLNASKETLVGQFVGDVYEHVINESDAEVTFDLEETYCPLNTNSRLTRPGHVWKKLLTHNNWCISAHGTVFDQTKPGIIPAILENWYKKRVYYKNQMESYEAQLAQLKSGTAEYNEAKTAAQNMNRQQFIYKIRLNSLYGAYSNANFRYFDLRIGESITGTGRSILSHQCATVNEKLTGEYNTFGQAIVAGDTDSTYFKTGCNDLESSITVCKAIETVVNQSFPVFMRNKFLCNDGFDGLIRTANEIIADSCVFVEKKRYIAHVLYKDGKKKTSLKLMGVDLKKTTLPKPIQQKLISIVEYWLMNDTDWNGVTQRVLQLKEEISNSNDISLLGLPKGVKKVEHYTQVYNAQGMKAKLPGHVAASIFWNECLDKYNDKDSIRITSGTKIRVYYLTKVYGKFKSIAIPTDQETIPDWFIKNYAIDKKLHVSKLVDGPLDNIFKAVQKVTPTAQSSLIQSLLTF